MLFFITLLLFVCIDVKGYTPRMELINNQHQRGILSEISPWILSRAKRNLNITREAYEKAINENIDDYYAQRKAVMDRYYARQRAIANSFQKNSSSWGQPFFRPNNSSFHQNESLPTITATFEQNPNLIANNGYQHLGDCSHLTDAKLLYQHNLGIGLKGPSQLDTNFQVNLDGPISITCVEALPYNNTQGSISWLSGGPGNNFVKLNLKALENKGVSYIIKVWGMKLTK